MPKRPRHRWAPTLAFAAAWIVAPLAAQGRADPVDGRQTADVTDGHGPGHSAPILARGTGTRVLAGGLGSPSSGPGPVPLDGRARGDGALTLLSARLGPMAVAAPVRLLGANRRTALGVGLDLRDRPPRRRLGLELLVPVRAVLHGTMGGWRLVVGGRVPAPRSAPPQAFRRSGARPMSAGRYSIPGDSVGAVSVSTSTRSSLILSAMAGSTSAWTRPPRHWPKKVSMAR